MFCQNCGTEIKEGKFCPNCGAPVEIKVEEPAPVQEEPAQSGEYYSAPVQEEPTYYQAEMPQQPNGEAPNTTLWIVLSVAALCCCNPLCGIIALVFSILGASAAGKGDYADAESKLKIAKIALIIGVAFTVIVSVFSFVGSLLAGF